MENTIVIKAEESPFLSKQIFLFKVNIAIKECNSIKEDLKSMGLLDRSDEKLNLILPVFESNEIYRKYFLFKGYNSDGSIKPLRKYYYSGGEVKEDVEPLKIDIAVVDIYERNVCLYNYKEDEKFIEGYVIKDEVKNSNRTLIFSKEKVKILLKNTNNIHKLNVVEELINKFVI